MVPSIRGLTCGLQHFCIDIVLPFHLTCSNDVTSRIPVLQMQKDKNIEKVVVETAGLLWTADVILE